MRLASYEPLAAALLDASGQPVSRWWPVAYALQRVNDARAPAALLALADTPGRYTASFAVRGLATTKAAEAVPFLRQIVEERRGHAAVVIQAVRALAALGDGNSTKRFTTIIVDAAADPALRLEAMTALATVANEASADLLVDLVADPLPWIRGHALRALARVDPFVFTATLAGLDVDRDWTVRAAIATALGTVPAESSLPRLTAMLQDRDQRVIPAVIAALGASRPPGVEQMLMERLRTDDFVGRSTAATALAEIKAVAAVPALIEAYRASVGDSTYVARAAILAALNRIDPAAARPVLQEALTDRDWAVRVRAPSLLREQGVPGSDARSARRPPGAPSMPRNGRRWSRRSSRRMPSSRPTRAPSRSSWPCSTRRSPSTTS